MKTNQTSDVRLPDYRQRANQVKENMEVLMKTFYLIVSLIFGLLTIVGILMIDFYCAFFPLVTCFSTLVLYFLEKKSIERDEAAWARIAELEANNDLTAAYMLGVEDGKKKG